MAISYDIQAKEYCMRPLARIVLGFNKSEIYMKQEGAAADVEDHLFGCQTIG